MQDLTGAVMVVLIVTNLALLGSSRMGTYIRTVAVQGIALGILPLLVHHAGIADFTVRFSFLVLASIGLRGIVFPWLLLRTIRNTGASREVEPYVGYTFSVIAGLGALGMSLWLDRKVPLPVGDLSPMLVPTALSTIFVGLFLIISRKKALTQILGYLVLENGIYTLSIAMLAEMPILVELGVLLDAFVAVFVMSVATYSISREFDHTDIEKLDTLKG